MSAAKQDVAINWTIQNVAAADDELRNAITMNNPPDESLDSSRCRGQLSARSDVFRATNQKMFGAPRAFCGIRAVVAHSGLRIRLRIGFGRSAGPRGALRDGRIRAPCAGLAITANDGLQRGIHMAAQPVSLYC
jgi:hypothetical protein